MLESGTGSDNPVSGGGSTIAQPDDYAAAQAAKTTAANPSRGGRRGTRDRVAARVAAALLTGVMIGALTSALQPHLNLPWFALVDASSPWLLGGFVAGALQSRLRAAVVVGLAACALEVAAYYATNAARGYGELSSVMVFWTVCAIIGGPVFGWAGWAWLRGSGRVRAVGAAFVPATFIGESIGSYWLELHYMSACVLFAVVGVALLAVVAWPIRRMLPPLLGATALLTLLGVVLYGPVLSFTTGGQAF